jgi:hypothetical protein
LKDIDFLGTKKETLVLLAFYLSIPEAENNRRSINVSDGMKRGPDKIHITKTNHQNHPMIAAVKIRIWLSVLK